MILDICQRICWSFIHIYILKCPNFAHFNQFFIDFFGLFISVLDETTFGDFSSRSVLNLFHIEGNLLYSVLILSAIEQNKSAIIIHISHPAEVSLPSTYSTPLGQDRVPVWTPVLRSNSSPAVSFAQDDVYMSVLLSPFILFSFSSTVSTSTSSISELPFFFCK